MTELNGEDVITVHNAANPRRETAFFKYKAVLIDYRIECRYWYCVISLAMYLSLFFLFVF